MNIDHSQDDISKADGEAPTLGGFQASRGAMSTGTATAGYYAKLVTLAFPATNNVAANQTLLFTPKSAGGSYSPVLVKVTALQGTGGLSASSKIKVLSSDETAIAHNDLFLVTTSTTNGTNIELWMQSAIAAAYDVQVLAESYDTGVSVSAWNNSATWAATDPTIAAATSVTSDWAGSGQLTSTSFQNGWAGTAYYEKSADGMVTLRLDISTVGTTTNGTAIFTIQAGFREGTTKFRIVFTDAGGTDGVCGFVEVGPTTGVCSVYDFNVSATAPESVPVMYRARA